MLSKFYEIFMKHNLLKSKNQQLKNDNFRLTEELKTLNILTWELNKLKAKSERLKEECSTRKTIEKKKLRELIGAYASCSKTMDSLLAMQKH